MALVTDLRRLSGSASGVDLTVLAIVREGEDLRVKIGPSGEFLLLLATALHQPRLFGAEPQESELAGTRLRLEDDQLERLSAGTTFTVVFCAAGESARSYLCDRARLIGRTRPGGSAGR